MAKAAECFREARGARPLVCLGSRDPSVDTLEAPVALLSQLSWRESPTGLWVSCPDLGHRRVRYLDSKVVARMQAKSLDSSLR